MDRVELPAVIIHEVGEVFKAAVVDAAPSLLTADLDGLGRCLQGLSRRVLGRVVEQVIGARVAATAPTPPTCPQCGAPTRCGSRTRPRPRQGLVGDFTLDRCRRRAPPARRPIIPGAASPVPRPARPDPLTNLRGTRRA